MQHPLAEVEVISWDSALLMIAKTDDMLDEMRQTYPQAEGHSFYIEINL
jgi:hypothetical protein